MRTKTYKEVGLEQYVRYQDFQDCLNKVIEYFAEWKWPLANP